MRSINGRFCDLKTVNISIQFTENSKKIPNFWLYCINQIVFIQQKLNFPYENWAKTTIQKFNSKLYVYIFLKNKPNFLCAHSNLKKTIEPFRRSFPDLAWSFAKSNAALAYICAQCRPDTNRPYTPSTGSDWVV